MEEHIKNLELYLRFGGNAKLAEKYKTPTLSNRSKVAHLVSKLKTEEIFSTLEDIPEKKILSEKIINSNTSENDSLELKPSKPRGLGLIAQYPKELHETYQRAYQLWIQVCALKIELNDVPRNSERLAFEIQSKMIDKIISFDNCKEVLDYYNEFKRIKPTKSKNDFSSLSPSEILLKRNNLRGLITRRKQTIKKQEQELPSETASDYFKKRSAINRKIEKLQELILDEQQLSALLK